MKNTRKLEVGQVRIIPGLPTSDIPDIYYVILGLSAASNMVRIKVLAGSHYLEPMWWDKEYVALDVVVM